MMQTTPSTTTTTTTMKELLRSTVDILIRNGWIIRLSIDFVDDDDDDEQQQHEDDGAVKKLKLLVYPNATISEIKTYLRHQLDIVETEQLLSMSNQLLLTGPLVDNLQRIYGKNQPITDSTKVRLYFLKLKRLPPMDPRLVSLLNSVGLDDWKKQDKMVAKAMTEHREFWKVGTECPFGHALYCIPEEGSDNIKFQCMFCGSVGYNQEPTDRSYRRCCHKLNHPYYYCTNSSYGVCDQCHEQEKSMASTKNKTFREVLEYLACSHGYYATAFAFRNRIDPVHKQTLLRFVDQVDIDCTSLFVHRGARLTVRIEDWTRETLLMSDKVNEGMVESIEIDKICEDGMSLGQLRERKYFWDKNKTDALKNLGPITDCLGPSLYPGIHACIEPESYTIEEVKLVVMHGVRRLLGV